MRIDGSILCTYSLFLSPVHTLISYCDPSNVDMHINFGSVYSPQFIIFGKEMISCSSISLFDLFQMMKIT